MPEHRVLTETEVASARWVIDDIANTHRVSWPQRKRLDALADSHDLLAGLIQDSENGRRALRDAAQALLTDIDANITGSVADYLAEATDRLRRILQQQEAE